MIDAIDSILSRVTMYRLVVYGLLTIAAMAALLMIIGHLPYSPIIFGISLVAIVCVAYGANRLFGWLFGVTPHAESAIITGLILALLFVPPETLFDGVKLALVAVIAMASKYIIAVRGKHIFNPAAIAIVIASTAHLAYAGWWIATPALLPVTIIAVGLILQKTRTFLMAGVFLAVAVVAIVLHTVMNGDVTTRLLSQALTSWPLVFLAGIMLCEPLTLPPRRWQQLVVAAFVGLLVPLTIHLGPLSMTPALALVLGNALAWYWTTRGAVKLRFVGKKQMTDTIYEFTFDATNAKFVPGQYVELMLPHHHSDSRGARRVFSIVGVPGDDQISIGTRVPQKHSTFKGALVGLKSGKVVHATRIAGDFVLPDDETIPVVLIAGGIGITPYISQIMSAGKRSILLIYSVSSLADLAYVQQLQHHYVNVTIVSPDEGKLPDAAWHHIIAPFLDKDVLEKAIDIQTNPHIYISGPPIMVNSVKRIVKSLGMKHIKTDHFTGY